VDLNKGSKEAIDSVFGHEHGRRVIEARPYKEVHELLTRNVVDEKKYHEVKDRVTVGTLATTSTASKTQAHSTQTAATSSATTTPVQAHGTQGTPTSTPTHVTPSGPGTTTQPPAQGTQAKTDVK
jgi:hypothetical protein